jgi:predicted CXXCH cytochrome family protein
MKVFVVVAKKLKIRTMCQALVVLALILIAMPPSAWAVEFQGCRSCHKPELERAEIRLNQHEPFMRGKCAACHAEVATTAGLQTKIISGASSNTSKSVAKVNWLVESSLAATEHSFLLPADQLGGQLVVDLRGDELLFPRQQVTLPLLKDVKKVKKTPAEPKISSITVLEVKRGVFLSVLIGWQTDALTDAQVRYGLQSLKQESEKSQRFGYSHQVRLYNLKPDERYKFQVISTDLFGRKKTSRVLEFSTEKQVKLKTESEANGTEIDLQSNIQRLGNDYLVSLQTDKPAAVFVGSVGEHRSQQVAEVAVAAAKEASHEGMSKGFDRSLAACFSCHRDYGQRTHPVNVFPKPDMTIPQEYPTLPDGRITCASCHLTHSSDHQYLAIKSGKRELCVGCHKDML